MEAQCILEMSAFRPGKFLLVIGKGGNILHRQTCHIWDSYENHMNFIWLISYENHKKRASYENHMKACIWISYDSNYIWFSYDSHMLFIWFSYDIVIIWESYDFCFIWNHMNYFIWNSYETSHIIIIWFDFHMVFIWKSYDFHIKRASYESHMWQVCLCIVVHLKLKKKMLTLHCNFF